MKRVLLIGTDEGSIKLLLKERKMYPINIVKENLRYLETEDTQYLTFIVNQEPIKGIRPDFIFMDEDIDFETYREEILPLVDFDEYSIRGNHNYLSKYL